MERGLENEQYWILSLNTEKYHWFYVHFCPFRGPHAREQLCFLVLFLVSFPIKIKIIWGKRWAKTEGIWKPCGCAKLDDQLISPVPSLKFLQQGSSEVSGISLVTFSKFHYKGDFSFFESSTCNLTNA